MFQITRDKKSDSQWLLEHVANIHRLGKSPEIFLDGHGNIFNPITTLKLCALEYYVNLYTRVLNEENVRLNHWNGIAFLDVFAGSGLNLIGKNHSPIAGSLPIAVKCHFQGKSCSHPFNHYYGIEKDQNHFNALEARMKSLGVTQNSTIKHDLAENALPEIISDIEKNNYHYLAFIDFEGVKGLSKEKMDSLLKIKGDLMITHILSERRTLGRAKKGMGDEMILEKKYGEGVLEICETEDDLQELYISNIKEHDREHIITINIESGNGYAYRLIFAIRNTKGNSQFIPGILALKKRIEAFSGVDAQHIINQLDGRMSRLPEI